MGRYPPEEDPEESPPLEAESAEEKGKRKQRNALIVVIMFVVVLAAILIGVFVSEDKNKEKVSESNQAGDPKSPSGEPQTYVSVNGPFEVEIPIYCPKNIGVYVDEGEAGVGFRQLALFLMNNVVNRNLEVPGFQNVGFGSNGGRFRPTEEVDMVMPPVADNGAASSIGQVGDELDSFQTNNQEENVDQADNSKSDGEYIYSAYGDYLLVTRASTGELVLKEQMPQIECSNDQYSGPEEVIGGVQVPEDNINDTSEKESRSYVMPPYLYCPRPYIQALLLDGSTLAVVVSGYGSQYRAQLTDSPVLNDFLSTHVRLYGTDELNKKGHELVPRGTQDIHGYYRRGFLIDGIAHIATMSSLNTWDWIVYPNERFNPAYQNLSKEEYLEAVKKNGDTIASRFVSQLIAELSMTAGAFPNVANLNLLTDDTSGVDGFESIIFGEGYANSMVQLTSFEMSQTSEDNELAAEITCQFLPTSWGEIYSADDMLIVAGQGYHFDPSLGASEDMTYLFGFSLDGVYTDPAISGKVPGYLLNPYSVDYVGGRLRVATTIQNRWFIDVVLRPAATSVEAAEEPPSVPTDESATSSAVSAISSGGSSGSSTGGLVKASGDFVFLSECTQEADDECFDENTERRCSELTEKGCDGMFYWSLDCPYELKCLDWFENSICPLPGEPCVDGKNFAACIDLEKQGCEILMVLESCPMRFECEPPPIVIPPWTPPPRITKNQIFVLDASDGAELEIVGNVTMGKPGEVFTSIRFFDSIAYAVTFEQTDPFYVISFEENPEKPVILGELNVTGFSSYMHSTNAANTRILGVGQEADEFGRTLGLQISLFNSKDPTNPTLLDRYVLEESDWSSSSVQWDYEAFRYLKIDDEMGRLILPVNYYSSDGSFFDGFYVFAVNNSGGISYLFDISHVDDPQGHCYYCASLQDRSFVIDGNVITFKGHSARSHNLDTFAEIWSLDFAWQSDNCCHWGGHW